MTLEELMNTNKFGEDLDDEVLPRLSQIGTNVQCGIDGPSGSNEKGDSCVSKIGKFSQELSDEIYTCMSTAAGELEHTLSLVEGKLTEEDFKVYKRLVAKIIIAVYCGLGDSILGKVGWSPSDERYTKF
jgi:hypothetical protein